MSMLAKYFSIIRNYVLSLFSQRKYTFNLQNTLLDVFRTNSRNIIGRNPSMVIPLLANQVKAEEQSLYYRPRVAVNSCMRVREVLGNKTEM